MTTVSVSTKVPASAKQVWDMIGGFNALPNWHPAIERSEIEGEGKGSLRTLHLLGGGTITERLEQLDDTGQLYSYSILSSPLPVANYTGTIRITEEEDGNCTVEWSSDFEPSGATEPDAVKTIQGIYEAGFENLRKMFGG